jgi:hypothetical protein
MRAPLSRARHTQSEQYATIDELAVISGLTREDTIDGVGSYLDSRELAIESEGGDIFLLTAPGGRTATSELPANLWEILRENRTVTQAGRSYRVCRSLERAGWRVVPRPERRDVRLSRVNQVADLGVIVGTDVIPVLIDPDYRALSLPNGVLSEYNLAGSPGVCVTSQQGRLDETVTAARKWMLSKPGYVHCYLLVLEAPRYAPVFVTAQDGGITSVNYHQD